MDGPTYAAAGLATALTIGVLIAVSRTSTGALRTVCLGAAAGTSFGLTATLIKETVSQYDVHGFVGVFTTWQTYAAACNGILGILLMQWALHSGPLIAAQPGFTLMDPLVSILWGVLVYNEVVRQGSWLVLAAVGGAGIIAGVIALARSPLFEPESVALTKG